MRCPFCNHPEDHVVDSRMAEEGRAIRRRRQCENCGQRYTTFERIEEIPLLVQKRSGEREPFSKEKLVAGIRKACKNRPVSEEDLERLAEDVIEAVKENGTSIVHSADLGMQILERLRVLDEIAYLRFASVYKDFQELNDFERELGMLQKKLPPKERSGQTT